MRLDRSNSFQSGQTAKIEKNIGYFSVLPHPHQNHENRILRVILGVEHESGIYFAMPCHLGKIMPTYNKKMQRGDQDIFDENFSMANI